MASQPPDTPLLVTRWFSLRRRLLALLLGGITLGWAAALVFSYYDAHHEIDEIFDANLAQVAQLLLALASEYDDDDDIARLPEDVHKYQKKIIFQLWYEDKHLLLRSQRAPTTPLTASEGFSEGLDAQGVKWRYYSQWDQEGELRAVVGENHEVRQELSGNIASRLLVPALLGLPLLAAWIWFATRQALAPIHAIADQVQRRQPQHLTPLVPATAPQELRPLVEALNGLLNRVEQALDHERRFTADAAHELRTPLAALSVQASVAARARDQAERDHALAQIAASARRCSHLIEQLLTLARLDPNSRPLKGAVTLDLVTAEVCADQAELALSRDIQLELDAEEGLPPVLGNAELLRILLRNLVDNALRYTPKGGRVLVSLERREGAGVRLRVSDNGPGIDPEHHSRALERFHRLAGQDIAGSGLGLSIVSRIAEIHEASLQLGNGLVNDEGGRGLGVTLDVPEVRIPRQDTRPVPDAGPRPPRG